jgi:glycosyltransferase involved in cell wall biosynthesis
MQADICVVMAYDLSVFIAVELERRQALGRFITGTPQWRMRDPQLMLGQLPQKGHLVNLTIPEYIWQAARRLPVDTLWPALKQHIVDLGLDLRFQLFDYLSSFQLSQCNLLISDGAGSGRCLQAAKRRGAVSVLLAGSTHPRFRRRLLSEERERFGVDYRVGFSDAVTERLCDSLEQFDYVDAASEFVRQSFIQEGFSPDRLTKNPYGTDVDHFRPAPKSDDVYRVLFVGLVGLRKGIQYLLPAFQKVARKDWELHIVGPVENDIRHILAQYEGLFKYTPGISMRDLPTVYNNASVMAFPSIEEGLARVIPQAMACGLPTIITHNSGGDELVRDGVEGFIVPHRDVEVLAERIDRLGCDDGLRAEMGRRARSRTEQFTWHAYARRFVDIYEGIVTEGLDI